MQTIKVRSRDAQWQVGKRETTIRFCGEVKVASNIAIM